MCLFFGQLVENCDHVECQIVHTIKALNEQSLFTQVISHHVQQGLAENVRPDHLPSISNFIEEQKDIPVFKVEEQEAPSMDYQCDAQQIHKN